jgi:hypothetical protein
MEPLFEASPVQPERINEALHNQPVKRRATLKEFRCLELGLKCIQGIYLSER